MNRILNPKTYTGREDELPAKLSPGDTFVATDADKIWKYDRSSNPIALHSEIVFPEDGEIVILPGK